MRSLLRSSVMLLLAPLATAGVLTVDPSGDAGAAFQAAIDAAADGDTLVLLPGDYSWPAQAVIPHIDGKGLTIVPASGTRPHISRIIVEAVPAGSVVVVRGLEISSSEPGFFVGDWGAISINECAGAVWVEDCSAACPIATSGGGFFAGEAAFSGARASNSAAVTFVRCQLAGGQGATQSSDFFHPWPATRGGDGAKIDGSKATFHGCSLKGGEGGHELLPFGPGAPGGAGLYGLQSQVLLAGCTIVGGDKVPLSTEPGDGIFVEGSGSSVWLRGSIATAGTGTPAAQDIDAPPGAVQSFSAPPRSLEISSPLHEGEAGTLVIGGQPGDLTAIFVSFKGAAQFLPGKQGAFLLGSPLFGPLLLAVNPSPTGVWTLPFSIASLNPPSLTEQTFLLQLVVHDGTQVLLEGGTSLTLLDASVP